MPGISRHRRVETDGGESSHINYHSSRNFSATRGSIGDKSDRNLEAHIAMEPNLT